MEGNYRISKGTALLMIGTALFFDFLQIAFGLFELLGVIPFVGFIFIAIGWILTSIFSAYAWLTFFSWFSIKKVSYFKKPSRVVKFVVTFLIEMSPLGFLPTWTVFVISTILESWKEDVKKNISENSSFYDNQSEDVKNAEDEDENEDFTQNIQNDEIYAQTF